MNVLGLALGLLALALGACGRVDPRFGQPRPQGPAAAESAEVKRLRAAVKDQPGSAEAHARLAQAYLRQHRLAEAAEEFKQALGIDPKHVPALLGLAQITARLNDLPKALSLAQQAVQLEPRNAQALNTLGVFLFQAGRVQEAAHYFKEALALTPRDPGMLINMARSQAQMERWEQAETYARQAMEADPEALEPRLLQSELALQQGRVEAAVAALEKLAVAHPQRAEVFNALLQAGELCRRSQALASAVKCYDQALRMAPGSLPARLGKAQALLDLGQLDQAIRVYEDILLDEPHQAEVINNLAYLYAEKGERLGRAFNMASRLVQANPDNATFRDTLGWILYRAGRYPEALTQLEEAVRREPNNGLFHYHRGQTLQWLKRGPEAVEALRKALELGLPPKEKKAAEAALSALQPGA